MKSEAAGYFKRHKRYDNVDGTAEICMGLMLLGFALLSALQPLLPEHSLWTTNPIAGLLFMYAVVFPVLGLGVLIQRWVKMHITWPRTGYVAFLRDAKDLPEACRPAAPRFSWRMRLTAVALISGLVAAAIAVLTVLAQRYQIVTLPRILYAAFMTAIYGFWVYQMGGGHAWKWLLVLVMALGLLAIGVTFPGDLIALSRPLLWFVAGVWLASGGATLIAYILHTHRPAADSQ